MNSFMYYLVLITGIITSITGFFHEVIGIDISTILAMSISVISVIVSKCILDKIIEDV